MEEPEQKDVIEVCGIIDMMMEDKIPIYILSPHCLFAADSANSTLF